MTSPDVNAHGMESAKESARERNREQGERDARVQNHTDRADDAIQQALESIRQIRKEMGFPFARSTRLEETHDPGSVD